MGGSISQELSRISQELSKQGASSQEFAKQLCDPRTGYVEKIKEFCSSLKSFSKLNVGSATDLSMWFLEVCLSAESETLIEDRDALRLWIDSTDKDDRWQVSIVVVSYVSR